MPGSGAKGPTRQLARRLRSPFGMTTICVGWTAPHDPVTLRNDGNVDGQISHGICDNCQRDVDLDLRRTKEYRAYLDNPTLDPRG